MSIKLGVHGVTGRVGRAIVAACSETGGFVLREGRASSGSASLGVDCGLLAGVEEAGVAVASSTAPLGAGAELWIDFTRSDVSIAFLGQCRDAGLPVVVGTTGHSAEQQQCFERAACDIPIVLAPNMSVGVNVVFNLLDTVSRVVGQESDIEIMESHHRKKLDAPSGTAVRMGEIIASALGSDLGICAVYGREGHTGVRPRGQIGFATVRGGDIVGEHTVMFAGEGERIEITHRGTSRKNFAMGALRAAAWLRHREPGLYEMRDVLGLR